MKFDYSDYEYLPECTDGCGAVSDWLASFDAAREVAHNHGKQTGHNWLVQERYRTSRHPFPPSHD